ncbi:MAG: site-specific integrase [Bacteroidota bacterium]
MYIQPTINLTILKHNPNRHGLHNVYLEFTLKRKQNRIALGQFVRKEDWVNRNGKYIKESSSNQLYNPRLMNMYLAEQVSKAKKILLEMQLKGEAIGFAKFKSYFIGHKSVSFDEYLDELVEHKRKKGLSEHTIRSYTLLKRNLKRYRPALMMHEINLDFLKRFDYYLRYDLGNDPNTVWTRMKTLRAVVLAAKEKMVIAISPFDEFKLTYVNKIKPHLSHQELDRLWTLFHDPTLSYGLRNTLRYFLFSCHTGLDFNDTKEISYNDIIVENGKLIISRARKKSGIHYVVGIPKRAIELIEPIEKTGKVFKNVISNQNTNKNLKTLMTMASINKRVTFHIGRHTFGTLSLNLGIPQEVVQAMMGHSDAKMTRHYAKVQTNYIINQLDKWNVQK